MPSRFDTGTYRAKVTGRVFKQETVNNDTFDVFEVECVPTARLVAGGQETPLEGNNRAWVKTKIYHEEWQDGKKVGTDKSKLHDLFMPSMRAFGVPEGKEFDADTCPEFEDTIVIYNKPNVSKNTGHAYDSFRLSLPRKDQAGGDKGGFTPPKTDPTVKAKLQMMLGGKSAPQADPVAAGVTVGDGVANDDDIPF